MSDHEHDEELLPRRIVKLPDEETNEDLEMEVVVELEVDGKDYALLTPPYPTLRLFAVDENEEGETSMNELAPEGLDELRRDVNEALKEYGVKARRYGGRYALDGELPEEAFTDIDQISAETDDGEEDFLIISELDAGDERYWLLYPVDQELHPVELVAEDRARALTDEELESMHETFEAAIQELDEMADEDDEDGHDHGEKG
jgi:hypothetical protein